MKEYLYTAYLRNKDELKLVTRAFSMKLSEEQLEYLDKDLLRTYPEYKLEKYNLEEREVNI